MKIPNLSSAKKPKMNYKKSYHYDMKNQGEQTMKTLLPHGQEGHCNIYRRDHDSAITGYGKHDCVCAFLPSYDPDVACVAVYVRIDHKWHLGMPTDKQVIRAFKQDQQIKGRWQKIKENPWPQNNSTEQWYVQI